jgi:hypothetical protein
VYRKTAADQNPVKSGGRQIFAQSQRIYTFNTKDFAVFPELTVIAPPESA